jgi:hypothetical protein
LSQPRITNPPAPHPLDFDWRYDEPTASSLAALLHDAGPILALGAPTVARLLEADGVDVTLIDHQPLLGVHHHIVEDAVEFVSERKYRTALVDPPWYPTQLQDWTITAARAVGVGGCVLVSVWPRTTRPAADAELAAALAKFSHWADIQRRVARLTYARPRFEAVASEINVVSELSRSPRFGELIRLEVRTVPTKNSKREAVDEWVRFVIND